MLNRFQGPSGERITKDILQRQRLLGGNVGIVEAVYKAANLKEFQPGETVIAAGTEETDIYFILTGEVSIEVHERLVATRGAACHLGEISLVNPALARTATVRAVEKTVCAVVSEPAFSAIADEFPILWRTIAIELSERLNERKKFHSPPNETPNLFIACSSEMLPVAQHIQLALSKKPMLTQIWTDSFFRASKTTIESLLDGFHDFDFAIIILGPDDIVISREQEDSAPRDNVVFELGLAMGALSRERTFIVYEHKLDIKIPSDLLGVTPLTYTAGTQSTLAVRLASVATQIQIEVEARGPK